MENIIIILAIIVFLALPMLVSATNDTSEYWVNGVAVQNSVRTPAQGDSSIYARVDGLWSEYPLVDFPEGFWSWNKERRHEYLDIFREMLVGGGSASRRPQLSGPHNGIIASYGFAREDNRFKLNNSIKGMGFLPKTEYLTEIIHKLETTMEESLDYKLDVLDSLYTNAEQYFAPDRLISLELYSEPEFQTQTFLNQMTNPEVVIVWMDIPTYKMKSIVRLLDPNDSQLSEYERLQVRYVNLMHSYFHGAFPKDYIAAVYYAIEIYDSSPGRRDARGTRIR